MQRRIFARHATSAAGFRCPQCGGNVVEEQFTSPAEPPATGSTARVKPADEPPPRSAGQSPTTGASPEQADAALRAFLEIVDCRPEEVKDVQPGRLAVAAAGEDHDRRGALGELEVGFGKHRGKKLKDVPQAYLDWMLRQNPNSKSFRAWQQRVAQYLSGTPR